MQDVLLGILTAVVAIAALVLLWRWLLRRCEANNRADWGGRWLNRLDGLNRMFCARFHRLCYEPPALPASGPALVVANHLSGLDPLVMIAACRRPLRFMIAAEQYHRWYLRWLFRAIGCIPVERESRPQKALAEARRALERGEVVALFPHGQIRLDHEPIVPIKRGVLHLAQVTGAPIYPMRLEGVRAQGWTVAAVLVRSRVRIKSYPPLYYRSGSDDGAAEKLAVYLNGQYTEAAEVERSAN